MKWHNSLNIIVKTNVDLSCVRLVHFIRAARSCVLRRAKPASLTHPQLATFSVKHLNIPRLMAKNIVKNVNLDTIEDGMRVYENSAICTMAVPTQLACFHALFLWRLTKSLNSIEMISLPPSSNLGNSFIHIF